MILFSQLRICRASLRRTRGLLHCLFVLFVLQGGLAVPLQAAEHPFSISGPGVNPSDFRITTFAEGLNFPVGMTPLSDGSMLVAVSNGSSFFSTTQGSLIRLADTDNDGVADSQTTLVNNVPTGKLSSLRSAGDLVFVTGFGTPITIYRKGAMPTDPLSLIGTMSLGFPAGSWGHPNSALAVRETPGIPGAYDLFFQLGSKVNFAATTETVSLTSDIGVSGTLAGDAIHMVRITDNGTSISGSNLTQVATGLRNAAGFALHPSTGDLYLQDNGIDGSPDSNEPLSADELNVIPAADIGTTIADFGFPNNYTEYRTGNVIGGAGVQPLFTFQPLPSPNGEESEGPNDIVFAPPNFPAGLNNGVFVGMHGRFSLGGIANEENPLVFANLDDNSYFQFIGSDEAAIGHLDGLMSTDDSLFLADISPGGGFGAANANTGKIYQIRSLVPEQDGDFDSDGDVDGNDFLYWQRNPSIGNLGDWEANFGMVSEVVAQSTNVPEPSSIWLSILGVATLYGARLRGLRTARSHVSCSRRRTT